ncbi:MAG: arsenic resistance protein, partial [Treponema sp.]|nr:arsenic resistance protein [Treponema sp.]
MHIFAALQPVFIIFSAFLGILLGKINIPIEQSSGGFIEVFLMTLLFFIFFGIDLKDMAKSFTNLKFSLSAVIINFVWNPVFAFLLAKIFFPEHLSSQIGFMMLMVTPCTDWYLIFTGLSKGNVILGSSMLPLNLVLQIILLPVYLFVFMGKRVSFDLNILMQSVLFVLFIPLLSASLIKGMMRKINLESYVGTILDKRDAIQLTLLCFAIISMFASQGSVLLANLIIFIKLLFPVMLFFIINFFLSLFVGKTLPLSFQNTIALLFTTSARNSP